MYYISNVQNSKTESHNSFEFVASCMRPHAELEAERRRGLCFTFQMFRVLKPKVINYFNSLPLRPHVMLEAVKRG